jgi:hypothetical protein
LDPHIPELLDILLGKARDGDLTALRLTLDRVFSVRDAAMAEVMTEIEELRAMLQPS